LLCTVLILFLKLYSTCLGIFLPFCNLAQNGTKLPKAEDTLKV